MERNTRIANIIDSVSNQARYDRAVKAVISNKAILAWILKCCVKEFEPFDISTISESIEGTPDVSIRSLHRNEGYPIEKRVIYYLSRLISGQYGTVFTHSHYEKIRKVYSIWFCTNVPKYKQNTISGISMQNEAIYGKAALNPESTDLMQGILVNLGNPALPVDNTILKLMNTLLSSNVDAEKKKQIMKNDYNIAMTEKIETEVSEMCNLSQGILNEGRTEGKLTEKKAIALKLHNMGMEVSVISDAVGARPEDVRKWILESLS